jgi:hypothetical protein
MHLNDTILALVLAAPGALADDDARAAWIPLTPKTATATSGAELEILADATVLAKGANPPTSVYELVFETQEREVQALKIEFLTHDSFPGGGPGRAFQGNLVLSEVKATTRPLGLSNGPEPVEFREALTDHSQTEQQDGSKAIDGDMGPENGWCPEGHVHHDDTRIVLITKKGFGFRAGTELRLELHFASGWAQHSAGRVRVSVTQESRSERLAPARRPPANAAIELSIERGVRYLLALQQPDGSWMGPDWTIYPVGMTALGAYTLMHCGLRPDHPAVKAAMSYISMHDPIRTYDIGCVLMAYRQAGEPYPKEKVKVLVKRLIVAIGSGSSANPSFWGYPHGHGYPHDKSPHYDLSNTQYALLGLRAAIAMGEKVSNQVLEEVAKDLLEYQGEYGSFIYQGKTGGTPSSSMVAAGMTCLLVCRDELAKAKGYEGLVRRIESGLLKGEDWFRNNWSVEANLEVPRNPQPNGRWYYYYVYGLERVGSIWNRRQIGGHDWYAEGAAAILKRQGPKGEWASEYGESDSNTCFALLFATRASSMTGKKTRGIAAVEAGDVAFTIHSSRENPMIGWVGELRGKVKSRLDGGAKVLAVDWFLNDEQVASVPMPALGTPTLERFTMKHSLLRNGRFELRARMKFEDGGVEDSNALVQYVDNVEEVRHREAVRDAGKNLAVSAAGAAVASSEWDGNYSPRFAIDGRAGSSWLPKKDDPNATLRLTFKRAPNASVLKLTQAQGYGVDTLTWSRAKEVEIQINGGKPERKFLLDDSDVKHRLVFKAATVKQVRVTVKGVYPGWDVPTAGFREVELFPVATPESSEEVSLFSACETVLKAGESEPHRAPQWSHSFFDPGPGFAALDYDDSAWSSAQPPFGAGAAHKYGAPWDTLDLWARCEFTAPENDRATYQVHVSVDDMVEVYVNGVWIGKFDEYTRMKFRGMTVPAGLVKPGRNVVAVKAKDTGGARYLDAALFRYVP